MLRHSQTTPIHTIPHRRYTQTHTLANTHRVYVMGGVGCGVCGVWGVCVMKEKANEWKRKRVKEEKKKEEGLCECVSAKMLPFTLPI